MLSGRGWMSPGQVRGRKKELSWYAPGYAQTAILGNAAWAGDANAVARARSATASEPQGPRMAWGPRGPLAARGVGRGIIRSSPGSLSPRPDRSLRGGLGGSARRLGGPLRRTCGALRARLDRLPAEACGWWRHRTQRPDLLRDHAVRHRLLIRQLHQ